MLIIINISMQLEKQVRAKFRTAEEGLTLETAALQSCYGCNLTLSNFLDAIFVSLPQRHGMTFFSQTEPFIRYVKLEF